jgi:hypothetical protein
MEEVIKVLVGEAGEETLGEVPWGIVLERRDGGGCIVGRGKVGSGEGPEDVCEGEVSGEKGTVGTVNVAVGYCLSY